MPIHHKASFHTATLHDDDLRVDFAVHTTPRDRVAIVVTEPLTRDESWVVLPAGTLQVFVDGAPALE